jgi:hypothetical protein
MHIMVYWLALYGACEFMSSLSNTENVQHSESSTRDLLKCEKLSYKNRVCGHISNVCIRVYQIKYSLRLEI